MPEMMTGIHASRALALLIDANGTLANLNGEMPLIVRRCHPISGWNHPELEWHRDIPEPGDNVSMAFSNPALHRFDPVTARTPTIEEAYRAAVHMHWMGDFTNDVLCGKGGATAHHEYHGEGPHGRRYVWYTLGDQEYHV